MGSSIDSTNNVARKPFDIFKKSAKARIERDSENDPIVRAGDHALYTMSSAQNLAIKVVEKTEKK